MTWNWYRHSNDAEIVFSKERDPASTGLGGKIRTRPANEEEIAELEEKHG